MAIPGRLNAVQVSFKVSDTGVASISASDVVQMIALPDHARVVDVFVGMSLAAGGQANAISRIGHQDTSLTGVYGVSLTFSATTGVAFLRSPSTDAGVTNYRVSVSASNEGFGIKTLDLTLESYTATATCSFQMIVYYTYEPGAA